MFDYPIVLNFLSFNINGTTCFNVNFWIVIICFFWFSLLPQVFTMEETIYLHLSPQMGSVLSQPVRTLMFISGIALVRKNLLSQKLKRSGPVSAFLLMHRLQFLGVALNLKIQKMGVQEMVQGIIFQMVILGKLCHLHLQLVSSSAKNISWSLNWRDLPLGQRRSFPRLGKHHHLQWVNLSTNISGIHVRAILMHGVW